MNETDQPLFADVTDTGAAAGPGRLRLARLAAAAGFIAVARIYVELGDYLWARNLYRELAWIAQQVAAMVVLP